MNFDNMYGKYLSILKNQDLRTLDVEDWKYVTQDGGRWKALMLDGEDSWRIIKPKRYEDMELLPLFLPHSGFETFECH